MVWAIARRLPRSAYLELDAHPARRVPYTFNEEIHKKNNTPHLKYLSLDILGYSCQRRSARIKLKIGAAK